MFMYRRQARRHSERDHLSTYYTLDIYVTYTHVLVVIVADSRTITLVPNAVEYTKRLLHNV